MRTFRVVVSSRAWLGLVAGLSIGLGLPFLVDAQEESGSTPEMAGPPVVVTLQKGEKIRGALAEFRDGTVRILPEGGGLERTLTPSEIAELDFAPEQTAAKIPPPPEPATQPPTPPPPEPQDGPPDGPKTGVEPQPKDEPRRPLFEPLWRRRPIAEERRKKLFEFAKQRADELLTPEERRRLHELMPREQNLTPGERKELNGLRQKLGLMDPEAFRRMTGEVMDDARQSLQKNDLPAFIVNHMKQLSQSTTDDERRRHIGSLFAAQVLSGREGPPPLKEIAVNLMRSIDADPAKLDDITKTLRSMFDLFCVEVDRPELPRHRGNP